MIGKTVGSYRITQKLAEGGMGAVFEATHDLMGRDAVVKVLLPEMSSRTEMVRRFFNEARAAASIHHPGIVEVFDMGYADDGRAFIVMEKLRGETLSARIQSRRLSIAEAASITRQIAGALGAAHELQIVHRDLKPDNIYIVHDPEVAGGERVKVLDFGIAKLAVDKAGSLMTAAGAIFGTPSYMAPEQCSDSATVDHRADLYALGCILYECLTGAPPFGHGGLQLLAAQLRDTPQWPAAKNPQIPDELAGIVMKLLEKQPEARYQSCAELEAVLRNYGTRPPTHHPQPVGPVAPTYAPNSLPPHSAPAAPSGTHVMPHSSAAPAGTMWTHAPESHVQSPVTTHTAGAGQVGVPIGDSEPLTITRTRKTGLLIGVGVVAVAAIVAISVITLGGGGNKDTEVAASAPGVETETDAGDPGELAGSQPKPDANETVESPTEPGTDENKPDDEATQKLADELTAAAKKKDYAAVARLFAEIPDDSPHKERTRSVHDDLKASYLDEVVAEANKLASRGKCSDIRKVERRAETAWADVASKVRAVRKKCEKKQDGATSPEISASGDEPDDQKAKSTADLVAEGKNAVKQGQHGKALRLCQDALKQSPGDQDAVMVCAIAACNLTNASKAKKYIRLLSGDTRKGMARQICLRNGVEL